MTHGHDRQQASSPADVWDTIGWATVEDPADQNMDLLPDRFEIDFGCPECGSAWVDLLAAGSGHTYEFKVRK